MFPQSVIDCGFLLRSFVSLVCADHIKQQTVAGDSSTGRGARDARTRDDATTVMGDKGRKGETADGTTTQDTSQWIEARQKISV